MQVRGRFAGYSKIGPFHSLGQSRLACARDDGTTAAAGISPCQLSAVGHFPGRFCRSGCASKLPSTASRLGSHMCVQPWRALPVWRLRCSCSRGLHVMRATMWRPKPIRPQRPAWPPRTRAASSSTGLPGTLGLHDRRWARIESEAVQGLQTVAAGDGGGTGAERAGSRVGERSPRPVVYRIAGGEVYIREAANRSLRFSPPYGGRVWDSGFTMAEWLETDPERLRGSRVLELGSGAGLVGLCCAMLGAEVTLTDGAESLMPLLQQNIEGNADAVAERGGSTKGVLLEWYLHVDYRQSLSWGIAT